MPHPASTAACSRKGFTLIELSIVLVIIGLIAGGILVGQEMIEAAKNRTMVSQIEQYIVSLNTFKLKYNCLPDDCANATQFFEQSGNGNGDGRVSSSRDGPSCFQPPDPYIYCVNARDQSPYGGLEEVTLLNEHLAKADLINLAPFNSRTDAIPDNMAGVWFPNLGRPGVNFMSVTTGDGRNVIRLAGNDQPHDNDVYDTGAASLWPKDAYYIDAKLDDGLPTTGFIRNERWVNAVSNGDFYGCATSRYENVYDVGGINTTALIPVDFPCMLSLYGKY